MNDQRAALEKILDKAETVDQVTLLETKHLLRDRLPAVLSELKLPTTDHAQEALRDYQDKESHLHRLSAPVHKIDALKSDLWRAVSVPQTASELLSAVRARIGEYGYSSARVLFELFQNADDAYRQQEFPVEDACFRVEVTQECAGGFRVIHWGRPVNHLGHDPEHGRRRGHGRDLLNMLLMNFSEKRPGDDLTGKFGLGFKSVHVLSDTVGIASGFITLRTAGGFLPKSWPRGMNLVERHRSQHGRKATVIDVPFSDETAGDGRKAIDAFRAAMSWLPACSRTIRRIHLFDGDPLGRPLGIEVTISHLFSVADSDVARFQELGVHANFTPHWFGGTAYGDAREINVGPERAGRSQLVGQFMRQGVNVTLSSDVVYNALRVSPFIGVEMSMTRRALGRADAPTMPPRDARISLEQALAGYTVNGAAQLGRQGQIGVIRAGLLADFIVLPQDPFEMDVERIHTIAPSATVVGGEMHSGSL